VYYRGCGCVRLRSGEVDELKIYELLILSIFVSI